MKDKIKVLLVSPYSAKKVGGIGTWSKSVVAAFAGSEDIEVLFQNTKSFLKFNTKSPLSRMIKGCVGTITILIQLFLNCLCKKPDVIHYTSSASWALHKDKMAIRIAYFFNIPFIMHWHFGRIPEIIRERGNEYVRLKRIMQLATTSIVIDKNSFKALELDGVNNCCYIPNALPDDVLDASQMTVENMKRGGKVLFVGHVIKTKGVYELVKSCSNVPGVQELLIVGPCSKEIKNDLISLAKERDGGQWMHFLGEIPRDAVFDYYRKCSVFVLPSYTEGFPYVVLEAMAFGCPIIATEVGAIPQMITKETGILIPSQNEERLTDAISYLINDAIKASELGANARREVVRKYGTSTVMKQYEQVWRWVTE